MKEEKAMSMTTAAMAVGGRAARPCDVCGRKRARWYCAADEAYLCEACDSSVHEANALALRHERVRLAPNGAPMKIDRRSDLTGGSRKKLKIHSNTVVPVAASLAKPLTLAEAAGSSLAHEVKVEEPSDHFTAEELTGNANLLDSPSASFDDPCTSGKSVVDTDFGHDFLVSDPADGNNALNSDAGMDDGIGNDWMGSGEIASGGDGVSELDLCGDRDLSDDEYCLDLDALRGSVSAPDQDGYVRSEIPGVPSKGKPFKSMAANSEWEKSESGLPLNCKIEGWNDRDLRQVPSLRLDYADVLNSWSDRGTLWTEDHNPQLVPDDSNSDIVGSFDLGLVPDINAPGQMPMFNCNEENVNAGNAREARVIRYREKRRTRLFSKKIRYEVRKLNAERRPRMKGRFVKRSPGRE